jgi:hypothetical protein
MVVAGYNLCSFSLLIFLLIRKAVLSCFNQKKTVDLHVC